MGNSCFYEISCLGRPVFLKSPILDGKQLFSQNQVFRRSRQLKIGVCRWKTAVFMKSGVQEVQRAQNRPFWMENSCFYRIRYLGGPDSLKSAFFDKNRFLRGPKSSKSAIWDGRQLFLLNQVFKRSTELKIGYFRWKTAVFIKSGGQEVHRAQNRQSQMKNRYFFMKLGVQEVRRA